MPAPVPYPAACRPQAWAAASSVALLTALLGLAPDVPGGTLGVAPTRSAVGALAVHGLRIAGAPLDVTVDHHGQLLSVQAAASGLRVVDSASVGTSFAGADAEAQRN